MSVARKIAIAAGAATLAAGGVAGAVVTPDAADDGLTKAAENVGQELPASKDSHPTKDQHPGTVLADDEVVEDEVEAPEEAPAEDEGEEGGPVDNHGAAVSTVAKATPSGPGWSRAPAGTDTSRTPSGCARRPAPRAVPTRSGDEAPRASPAPSSRRPRSGRLLP